MKFFRIFLILFVIYTAYVMRDDLKLAFEKTKIEGLDFYNRIVKSDSSKISTQNTLPNSSREPGPLVLAKKIKDASLKDEPLTIDGIISATNEYRKKANLSPLTENKKLDISALIKTKDMFDNQYFEHVSLKNVGVADLAHDVSYEYVVIGENLAMGNFQNSQDVVDAWFNSPGHRANMLNTRYTEIGVGVMEGQYEGKKVWMAVQHFGLPRSACPLIQESLKIQIQTNQAVLKNYETLIQEKRGVITKPDAVLLSNYSELISAYNSLIEKYNTLVRSTKKLVDEYNNEVKAFNDCALPSKE